MKESSSFPTFLAQRFSYRQAVQSVIKSGARIHTHFGQVSTITPVTDWGDNPGPFNRSNGIWAQTERKLEINWPFNGTGKMRGHKAPSATVCSKPIVVSFRNAPTLALWPQSRCLHVPPSKFSPAPGMRHVDPTIERVPAFFGPQESQQQEQRKTPQRHVTAMGDAYEIPWASFWFSLRHPWISSAKWRISTEGFRPFTYSKRPSKSVSCSDYQYVHQVRCPLGWKSVQRTLVVIVSEAGLPCWSLCCGYDP